MSEEADLAVNAAEQAHRYSGAVGIGDPAGHIRLVEDTGQCVVLCAHPPRNRRRTRRLYCPSCRGKVSIRTADGAVIISRWRRIGAWLEALDDRWGQPHHHHKGEPGA